MLVVGEGWVDRHVSNVLLEENLSWHKGGEGVKTARVVRLANPRRECRFGGGRGWEFKRFSVTCIAQSLR